MTTINDRIRRRRQELKLTQEDIAKSLGVSYQAVQNWEKKSGAAPRRKRMEALANLLHTTVAWLETGIDQTYPHMPTIYASEPDQRTYGLGWPFTVVTLERVLSLNSTELGFVEGKLSAAIEECENARRQKRQGNGRP